MLCSFHVHRSPHKSSNIAFEADAVRQRFFRSLKVESISRDRYQTSEELAWTVKKYIYFYNTQHIHATFGSVSPNQCEQLFLNQA